MLFQIVYFAQCAALCASLFLCLSSSYSERKDRGGCGAGACYIGIIVFIIVTIIIIIIIILLEIGSIGGSSQGKVMANLYTYWTSQELHLKKYETFALTASTGLPNPTSSRSKGQDHNHAHDLHDHLQHEKKAAEVR